MKALVATMMLITLGAGSGAALADNHYDYQRDDHRIAERHEVVRVEHYRDFHARPAVRLERHEERRGFRWIGGEWRWNGFEWIWSSGHYARIARW